MVEIKTKLLVWCMGDKGKKIAEMMSSYSDIDFTIVGYTDSYLNNENTLFYSYPVYQMEEIEKVLFDAIVIATEQRSIICEVESYINKHLRNKYIIWDYQQLISKIRTQRIMRKYDTSDDPEIRETLEWLKNHNISVRNQWENTNKKFYEVFFDKEKGNFPYVLFQGKRMYYPKDYEFEQNNGKYYLTNIVECDQYENSPHLYIYDSHAIKTGDTIVDAGVAEGNFTLSYIDIISKAYLIESDTKWLEALELTFLPYRQKVEIIPKMLSDEDTKDSITLDTILNNNKVDFIKMDIEGAETKALLGGLNVLRHNDVRLSVCAYHRKRDQQYISFLLESLGYRVSHSKGYMFFLYSDTIDETLDFRRGVIYASK